jgi:ribose transport system ATP-binding protein
MKALELRGISKSFFGVYALRDVSLNIDKGRILGLIGQNGAGKSTLMNIIGGVVQPDAGSMLLNEQPYTPRNPASANQKGIAFIHQELNLFSNLSIAENIFIDNFPQRRIGPLAWIDLSKLRTLTHDLLAQVDLQLAPETAVEWLSPGERQLVEIGRALQLDASIIIFDEPTTSLTARETKRLFEIMNRLREAGKTIIYISHILADVMTLADDIAVLRDGELVDIGTEAQFDINRMISLMVGRSIEQLYPTRSASSSQMPVLQTKHLTERGIIKDISFTLHKGEVLGLFGLMGSGRTELARTLFGMDSFESGEIVVHGTGIHKTSPRDSIRHRVAFVTENRREEGLLMNLPIAENIALVSLSEFATTPLQLVDQPRLLAMANSVSSALQIKASAIDLQLAKSLSGGNQQKVVIAKWLMSSPSIFIMDEPTRGIDVSAKYEIYSIINDLAAKDGAVLFISSELEELMMMCDRLLVMSRGEIVGEFEQADFDKEQILRSAFREGSENKHVEPSKPSND